MKSDNWLPDEIRERVKILIVEDNLLNQKLDAFLLNSRKIRFRICDNGREAVELLKTDHFDLVLMDIQMPVLDGYESTRIIRSELGLDVPIIGITAHPSAHEEARCLAGGMNNYLSKPVDEERFFELICRHLIPQQVEDASQDEE
jgi:CheY-like chemotaxis protein